MELNELREWALIGLEVRLAEINNHIVRIKEQLTVVKLQPKQKHKISPEGIARIRAAQKKRWALVKKSA